ncbi:MAG: cell division protein ZapA [Lachnospiraceae bacterium]|nr:cell division protein ZapA [Lachnospiraceae bacterium]
MEKKEMQVIINKKLYTLCATESEEYIQKVVSYLNAKFEEMNEIPGFDKMSMDYQNIMLSVNIVDEYMKMKDKISLYEAEMKEKDKIIFDLRHENIDIKMKEESTKKLADQYKSEVKSLQKEVKKLNEGQIEFKFVED